MIAVGHVLAVGVMGLPALSALSLSACEEPVNDVKTYRVAFGVMVESDRGENEGMLYETTKIPMTGSMIPGFAFIVDPSHEETYSTYSIHHLPAPPGQLTGDFAGQGDVSPQVVRTRTERVQGVRRFDFGFSPGDPLGKYRVEVFVDDVRVKTIEFEAVPLEEADERVRVQHRFLQEKLKR